MLTLESLLWTYLEKVSISHLTIEYGESTTEYETISDCLRNCCSTVLNSAVVDARWCWNNLIIEVERVEETN